MPQVLIDFIGPNFNTPTVWVHNVV
jgi:hypothetical protein